MNSIRLRNTIKIVVILAAIIFQFVLGPKAALGQTLEEKYNRMTPEQKKKFDMYSDQAEKIQFPVFFGDKTMEDAHEAVKYLKKKDVPSCYQAMVAFMHRDTYTLKRLVASNDRRYQAESLFYLGMCHEYGWGCGKDYAAAAQMYRKASNLGYGAARFCLAHLYANGDGVERDYEEASALLALAEAKAEMLGKVLIWSERRQVDTFRAANALEEEKYDDFWRFSKTADRDNPKLQVFLGFCCENGLGCEADLDEAAKWYGKAKKQGDKNAAEWAMRVDTKRAVEAGVNKRYDDFWRFSETADRDNPTLQAMMGVGYEEGLGCEKNLDEAAKWYARALKQGYKKVAGPLMRVNTERAIQAFKANRWKDGVQLAEMADEDNAEIQYYMGYCCEYGIEVQKNLTKAVSAYTYAAKKGVAVAQYRYGKCLENGVGGDAKPKEALVWLEKAAAQGLVEAMMECAAVFEHGKGTDKNPLKAEEYYRKAAAKGCRSAASEVMRLVTVRAKRAFASGNTEEGNRLLDDCDKADAEIQYRMAEYKFGISPAIPYAKSTDAYDNALEWCRKAVAQNHTSAGRLLVEIETARAKLAFSLKDWAKAMSIVPLANQGDPEILYYCGLCHEEGHGVRQDLEKALPFYEAALAKGHGKAKNAIERVRAEIIKTPRKYREALAQFSVNVKALFPNDKIIQVPSDADIDKAIESCPDGGTLLLSAGEYLSRNYDRDNGHNITKNIRIKGVGPEKTVVRGRFWICEDTTGSVCLIENIKIIKAIQSGSFDSVNLIGVAGTSVCVVNNCILDGAGVFSFGDSKTILYKVSVCNPKITCLHPHDNSQTIILDSVFCNLGNCGIFLSGNRKVYADGLTIDASYEYGIYLCAGGMLLLRNSVIRNIKKGFWDFSSDKHHGVGIVKSNWKEPRPYCLLDNVRFENCSEIGIEAKGEVLSYNSTFHKCGKDSVGQIKQLEKSPNMDMEGFFAKEF